jgi:HPt (histidine-containing phosphotransfer) domain-containing protein
VNAPALDGTVLDRLRQLTPPGGPDVLVEILTVFRDDAPRRVETLRAALDGRDADGAHRAAHSLKGSAGNIGAGPMQAICRAIEDRARAGDLAGAAALVGDLEREFARVRAEIETLLRNQGASKDTKGTKSF